ncbi:aquaporin-like protein [Favolaschia claudopus]|uniref:Aquaporin-like protein n=1 Tax=Favolaschia claudopus TaxID=2862362 RepID=A0AAW0DBT8_9AGAR
MSRARHSISSSGSKGSEHFIEDADEHLDHESITVHPNAWSKYRLALREYVAEFLGVCVLILFGNGVNNQVVLSSVTGVASSQKGSYLSISFGWGIGTAMGVWVSGGISGGKGHINPAVTIAMATYRGFPWKKVPGYILAQVLGGLVGAALVYGNYFHAIDIFEGGRGVRNSCNCQFSTYALDYMTRRFMLLLGIPGHCPPAGRRTRHQRQKQHPCPTRARSSCSSSAPYACIGASLGMETAYAINPARDLGPRLLTSMVGYGSQVYTYRNHYWLWCPIIAPILGAQAGSIFYDAFIYTGEESPFNKPNAAARAHRERASHAARRNLPAGPGAEDQV